ncbi:MAG TPA: M28 family peptidase, partial [Pyrinomonadaceae bacterium]|nr:M28 family peptidase [Pyrinomonadaceae bacterium]
MKRTFLGLLLLTAFVSQSLAQAPVKISSLERKVAEGVTAKQMSEYLHFVASDEMEGRNTPSRGLNTVAKFIALNLERWGFKPAGDNGTYFQNIDLSTSKVDTSATSVVLDGQTLAWGTDYLASPVSGTAATAPLVWGGTGFFVKGQADPFAGIDPKGKIVVIYSEGLPRGMDFQTFRSRRADVEDPITHARKAGAVGVITLSPAAAAQNWDRTRRQRETGGNFAVDKFRMTSGNDNFPVVALSPKASDALLAGTGFDTAALSKAYPGTDAFPAVTFTRSASLNVAAVAVRSKTQNVVAIWEGSDPKMKDEMVAVGAHYDHVGMSADTGCRPIGTDTICNGADDDGSGTVAVLSMAEALAKAPKRPKRSVLFVWHCGEEKGLWGSEYFNKWPTVDVKKVIAQLNIDMIGRSKKAGDTEPKDKDLSGENAINVIGKDMMSSSL